jgi:hypothetical protein
VKKLRTGLSLLLVLQLLLAAGLYISSFTGQSDYEAKPLLDFDQGQVNKVVIRSGDSEAALAKREGGWVLPELYDLPVNESKLEGVLSKIAGLETGWPVATTEGSHRRFEVAEDKFQRHIQLYQGEQIAAELYLGTSPSFRKVHGRPASVSEVYVLELNVYDLPAGEDDWLDKTLLAPGEIAEIRGPDYVLAKLDGSWILSGENGEESAVPDEGNSEQLFDALGSLTVSGVAKQTPGFDEENIITLEVKGESGHRYQFLAMDDKYYLKSDRRDQVFTLSKYDYDRTAGIRLADLQKKKEEDAVSEGDGEKPEENSN